VESAFKPFERDAAKQSRYDRFLQHRDSSSVMHECRALGMQLNECHREREEFEKSAAMFSRPAANPEALASSSFASSLASRFAAPLAVEDSAENAARAGMFGKLTRSRAEWRPDKIICKRFNVPDPFFGRATAQTQTKTDVTASNARSKIFGSSTAAAAGFEQLLLSVAPAPPPPPPQTLPIGGTVGSGETDGVGAGVPGAGKGLLSLVASDAPVSARPPADVFKSIFDDDSDDDDDDDPVAPAPAPLALLGGSTPAFGGGTGGVAAVVSAGGAGGGDVASLEGMLSFFASKSASEGPGTAVAIERGKGAGNTERSRKGKSRWDVGTASSAASHSLNNDTVHVPPAYAAMPPPAYGAMPPPSYAALPPPAYAPPPDAQPVWPQHQQLQHGHSHVQQQVQQHAQQEQQPLRAGMHLPSPSAVAVDRAPPPHAVDSSGVGPFTAASARRTPTHWASRLHNDDAEELRSYEDEQEEEDEVRGNQNTMALLEAASATQPASTSDSHSNSKLTGVHELLAGGIAPGAGV